MHEMIALPSYALHTVAKSRNARVPTAPIIPATCSAGQRYVRSPRRLRNFREKCSCVRLSQGGARVADILHLTPVVHGEVQGKGPRCELFTRSYVRQPQIVGPRADL